jgi:hypothetical protein
MDNPVTAKTDNDGDLSTTKFATLEGTVTVNLPPDTTEGDVISGTVVAEPKGRTPEEKAANQDMLEGYVVEVAKQPLQDKQSGKWTIPPQAKSIDVVLKDKNGEVVSQTKVPVSESALAGEVIAANTDNNKAAPGKKDSATPPLGALQGQLNTLGGKKNESAPRLDPKIDQVQTTIDSRPVGRPAFQVPAVGQVGKYVRVIGPFDGNLGTTSVKIGDNPAPPLAESPRGSIVKILPGATGATKIDVTKDGRPVASCPFTVLGLKLAASKLNLKRGETSELTITVTGVGNLKSGVPVQIDNKFPQTMRLGGGDSQTLMVPAGLTADTFSATRTLTGVEIGAFAITAVVKPPPCAAGGCAACNPDSSTSESSSNPKEYPTTKTASPPAPTGMPSPMPTPMPTPQQATVVKSKSNITNNRTASGQTTAPQPAVEEPARKYQTLSNASRQTPDPQGERRQPLPSLWAAKAGPVEGLVVQVSRKDGTIVATATTDKDGNVDFGVLPKGEYVLTLISPKANGQETARTTRDWIKTSMDGKTEQIEMKHDSGRKDADSGQTTLRSDGKTKTTLNCVRLPEKK